MVIVIIGQKEDFCYVLERGQGASSRSQFRSRSYKKNSVNQK